MALFRSVVDDAIVIMGQQVSVAYGLGWDVERADLVDRIPVAVAEELDRSGAPYAVLLTDAGLPVTLYLIERAVPYIKIYHVEAGTRRMAQLTYRGLGGDLRLHSVALRSSKDVDVEQFWNDFRLSLDVHRDGSAMRTVVHRVGRADYEPMDIPSRFHRLAPIEFGQWLLSTAAFDAVDPMPVPDPEQASAGPGHWRAPRPFRPGPLDELFVAGTRLRSLWADELVEWEMLEPEGISDIVLPTGRIIACDPALIDSDGRGFTVTVAPGTYRVDIALARDRRFRSGSLAAARLLVSDKPTCTWELAVQAGQDPWTLGDGQFFGFGVDTGTGCFVDECAAAAMAGRFDAWAEATPNLMEEDLPVFTDLRTGATMVTYVSGDGDGSYPVWIGRDADGEPTCFVADMLILRDPEVLPVEGVAVCPPSRFVDAHLVGVSEPTATMSVAATPAEVLAYVHEVARTVARDDDGIR